MCVRRAVTYACHTMVQKIMSYSSTTNPDLTARKSSCLCVQRAGGVKYNFHTVLPNVTSVSFQERACAFVCGQKEGTGTPY